MSELIPSYPLSEFKKLNSSQIRGLKSCELTSDGKYLCTIICPNTEYIKFQAESMAQLSNSVGGETLEQILAPPEEEAPVEEAPVEEVVPA